jgi:predicted DNA-binding transcriptional regulator AlpA
MKSYRIQPEERIGMSREEAAEYIGVSATLFDDMVEDGRMPKPKAINARRVWSRKKIEQAFDALPEQGQNMTSASPWGDLAA